MTALIWILGGLTALVWISGVWNLIRITNGKRGI